jgi:tRNA threonylcarbamoyladenosine biosynthesis protein TsaE
LYHFDFYRFKDSNKDSAGGADEMEEAGFREYFNERSLCLIEWPERAGQHLARPDLTITLDPQGAGRSAVIAAQTEAGRECIKHLQS